MFPLKPITSPPPSSKAPKFNPCLDWTVGEVQPEGVAPLAPRDPSHSPQELQVALQSVGVSRGVLGKVKCKLGKSKETLSYLFPELK